MVMSSVLLIFLFPEFVAAARSLRAVSDGNGGAFCVYSYTIDGKQKLYLQKINSAGSQVWSSGKTVSDDGYEQLSPDIIADGSSGVIIVWQRAYSSTDNDIMAQKFSALGTQEWGNYGTYICTDTIDQQTPRLVTDNSGGAIIVWIDYVSGDNGIYGQRVNSAGANQWGSKKAICDISSDQINPELISCGAHGAMVVWQDLRSGNYDIYAQRVDSSGNLLWAADGNVIINSANHEISPKIVSNGSGGAFITWLLDKSTYYEMYIEKLDANGNSLCMGEAAVDYGMSNTGTYVLASDGQNGAIMAWDGADGYLRANRFTGSCGDTWHEALVSNGGFDPTSIIPDGGGGAFVAFMVYNYGNSYVSLQKISSTGTRSWGENGYFYGIYSGNPDYEESTYGTNLVLSSCGKFIACLLFEYSEPPDYWVRETTDWSVMNDPLVLQPTYTSAWWENSTYNITWSKANCQNAYVKILLHKPDDTWTTISSSTPNDCGYAWKVPLNLIPGSGYSIKVQTADGKYSGTSYSFQIKKPSISIKTPAAGSTWQRGHNLNITWTKTGPQHASVKILLYRSGVYVQNLTSSTANDGSFQWLIPASFTKSSQYKIIIKTLDGGAVQKQSGFFTIN